MCPNKILRPRIYILPNSEHQIILTKTVLETFSTYIQQGTNPEAGGLLFAEFVFPVTSIVEATPPGVTDRRWRTLFIPNRTLQRQLIKQRFKDGYHFVGEWHTHPLVRPTPSTLDLESTADSFLKSRHELNYFIMVIIGNASKNLVLWVSIHDRLSHYRLKEIRNGNDKM